MRVIFQDSRLGLMIPRKIRLPWEAVSQSVLFLEKKKKKKKKMQTPPHPVVILVGRASSNPVLYFYQVSSKYCKGYSDYRADTKSNSNTRRGDKSKSKKASYHSCTQHVVLSYSTFLPSKIKIIRQVLELQSGHEIKFKHKGR